MYCLVLSTNEPKTNNEARVVSALASKTSLGNKVHREKTNLRLCCELLYIQTMSCSRRKLN